MNLEIKKILFDLENSNYWDKQFLNNGFSRLQLRQEWDYGTNTFILNEIIKALKIKRLLEEEENLSGKALVDIQNWLSKEGKFSTEIINSFCRKILGKV